MRDPSEPIAGGKETDGVLPVSGTAFYTLQGVPGQLIQASLTSKRFVPLLRLYDANGNLLGSSGEDSDTLESRITHMVTHAGLYRLQVSSLGDGGGGDYRLALKELILKDLPVGGRGQGTAQTGNTDFWAFEGKEGQIVFLSVRSTMFEPIVVLRSPDGAPLAAENKGTVATGSLLAVKLPRSGRYTMGVSPRRGAGDYTVRLIDGD